MSLPYNKDLIPYAKELRKNATPWERKLWYYFLKDYPIRFQRQKVIDDFIVDFYCYQAALVIELDGGGHFARQQKCYDVRRTEKLNVYRLKVLRFSNLDIDKNFYEVCSSIDREVKSRLVDKELPQSPAATAPSKRER